MAIDPKALREHILFDAQTDDWGLFEVIWHLNTAAPAVSAEEKTAVAKQVVSALLQEHSLYLFRSVWPPSEGQPLSTSEALAAIDNPAAWLPPGEDGMHIRFAAR